MSKRDANVEAPGDDEVETVANSGDGPTSTTSGQFPADEVRETYGDAGVLVDTGDGPDSSETCGQFPADEVRETYEDEYGGGGGIGGGGDGPHIATINPTSVAAGTVSAALSCYGTGFTPESVVELDQAAAESSTMFSPTRLDATFSAPATEGTLQVTVRDTATDMESNSVPMTVAPAAGDA